MLLVIDHHDSFTFNLVQGFASLGAHVVVVCHDAVRLNDLETMRPEGIVLSPGPGRPDGSAVTLETVRRFAGRVPILGVCLGHQAIAMAFGGRIVPAPRPMHGHSSLVHHGGEGIFEGLPSPLRATRYHSLAVERASLPAVLRVTAESEDGTIMGLRHEQLDVEGVQFHPESFLTEHGERMLATFLGRLPAAGRVNPRDA
ncbi:MAG: aminodeoxychorismate/anthranilate synthase component II [Myxococcota bacterium]|nr:aminodeoxychorismate/anthranilate synthase component II [Myxococcota bacterium]MDW8362120.1 aminodeoxychorismate/anthranilate synthase component II [Myxococcales bacterium]